MIVQKPIPDDFLSLISGSMANGKTSKRVKPGRLKIMKEGVKTRRAESNNGEQEGGGKARGTWVMQQGLAG